MLHKSGMLLCLAVVLTTTLNLVQSTDEDSACPSGYRLFEEGKTCLKVDSSESVTWEQARQRCTDDGGDLAVVGDQGIMQFIAGLLSPKGRYWIGLTKAEDGSFQWLGEDKETSYSFWGKGRPNNYKGKQECVQMVGKWRGRWNDRRCTVKANFVCQKAMTPKRWMSSADCDFEDMGKCNWVSGGGEDMFVRVRAADATAGPSVDHSLGNGTGHYDLLQRTNGTVGQLSFKGAVNMQYYGCFSFYHSMKGDRYSYVSVEVNGKKLRTYHQALDISEWRYFATMISAGQDLEVVIKPVFNNPDNAQWENYMAIDDIKLAYGLCVP